MGTQSYRLAFYAKVVDNPSIDIDDIAARLKDEFPGMPATFWDAYVMATAKAANEYPIDTVLQIYSDGEKAQVRPRNGTRTYTLFEKQPVDKGANNG